MKGVYYMRRESKSESQRWLIQAKRDLDDAIFAKEGEVDCLVVYLLKLL
ncbi:MAG: hypothetical protein PWQ34_1429 [Caldanaerobacter sp.]|uniref:Uncharacterized protein n=1 Tax=Caldanaerobacter subterraneus subsp. pacificus DSM 12653 TaxID=391606 RepID=A0A0F5PQ53_9THEO|nr:hypothetical protein CDSM653_00231 [Caldanaerobacter subterraneus subsp. pacificus DSM 12653]MDI3519282.1 hypothetical protein [Caldanaerobacter sp.]